MAVSCTRYSRDNGARLVRPVDEMEHATATTSLLDVWLVVLFACVAGCNSAPSVWTHPWWLLRLTGLRPVRQPQVSAPLTSVFPRAQVNEPLYKVLCHNLCCVIQSMYELGIEPEF